MLLYTFEPFSLSQLNMNKDNFAASSSLDAFDLNLNPAGTAVPRRELQQKSVHEFYC